MPKPTVGSLFSGIGGIDLAAQWAGLETAWFVEKEPYPQTILHKHWPDVPVYGDIFECHDLPYVDVIVGGFPCQPFSVAGKRQGANDERFLLPEMLRIISEVNPYAVLFENVPGFPSLNDGAEFKFLLRALAEMGFDAEWGHLRASDCGAPHQRGRWFLVAYSANGWVNRWQWKQGNDAKSGEQWDGQNRSRINGRNIIELADADNRRRQQRYTGKRRFSEFDTRCTETWNGSKSLLGRSFNGLPDRLDFPGWPSRPGEPQHEWEPPRVTSGRTPNRAARLKALGNAVVPQVVYPLMVAIREWLEELALPEAANGR